VSLSATDVRELFVGLDIEVPLLDGRRCRYVNLDNAATTPPLRAVVEHVNQWVKWYSSVHRGTGFKSLLSTHAYNRCREKVGAFVGIDPSYHTVIFCGNTTDAINRLCCRFPLEEGEVVLTTVMEHHSNLLPWRFHGQVDYVRAKLPSGMLDIDHLQQKLHEYDGKVRLVAVTGASNITGLIPPLKQIARLAHEHGAMLLVDASQLIAHRRIVMGSADDPERIDFLAFSGHKLYAPFGSGGLIGPRDFFKKGRPGLIGGGAVDLVSLSHVEWTEVPEKEEAGTPNLIGICAMVKAMETLEDLGMENIAAHEQELTEKIYKQLEQFRGIRIYGSCDPMNGGERLGVIPIQSDKYNHALLGAILGYEWGIGVRNGCFCAHAYVEHLLEIDDEEIRRHLANIRRGDQSSLPGFVRISLGLYNTEEEIEYLAEALHSILNHGPKGRYYVNKETGEYIPQGFSYDFDSLIR
jgi:cysteine desulfurase/selenocysteine lyase